MTYWCARVIIFDSKRKPKEEIMFDKIPADTNANAFGVAAEYAGRYTRGTENCGGFQILDMQLADGSGPLRDPKTGRFLPIKKLDTEVPFKEDSDTSAKASRRNATKTKSARSTTVKIVPKFSAEKICDFKDLLDFPKKLVDAVNPPAPARTQTGGYYSRRAGDWNDVWDDEDDFGRWPPAY